MTRERAVLQTVVKIMLKKTNAVRILDRTSVSYELISYEVDESDLSAVHVAELLNESLDQIFKTLVLKGNSSGYFVCIVPGGSELDLKKAAKASGNKSCDMIPLKDLQMVTGYIRGACSPFGMKKNFPLYIHESCRNFDRIYVSAGIRGLQIHLSPADLVKVTDALVLDLIHDPQSGRYSKSERDV